MDQLRADQIGPFLATLAWVGAIVLLAAVALLFGRDILAFVRGRPRAAAYAGIVAGGVALGYAAAFAAPGAAPAGLVGALAGGLAAGLGSRFMSTVRPADYDKGAAEDRDAEVVFPASRAEAEAEAAPEAAAEDDHALVTLTEKALQTRDADNVERGMILAFAAMHKGGYLPAGKATEIKRAMFGVSGGRKLQALNAAIDAVQVVAQEPPAGPPPAAAPAEPPKVKPVTGAPVPPGQQYAGISSGV